jgi:hypothetical protein
MPPQLAGTDDNGCDAGWGLGTRHGYLIHQEPGGADGDEEADTGCP